LVFRGAHAIRTPDPAWSNNSCGAAIELEQASESLVTLKGVAALAGFIAGIREKQLVAFALMVLNSAKVRTIGPSPNRINFDIHSCLTDRTQRSAKGWGLS
jgi:hypothetical protein